MSKSIIEYLPMYLKFCRSKELRERTWLSYEQSIKLFARWLKDNDLPDDIESITDGVIRAYINDLKVRGKYTISYKSKPELNNSPDRRNDYGLDISNTTINNYLRNLRAFFHWLEDSEFIVQTPMRRIKMIPNQRRRREFLDDHEVLRLITKVGGKLVYKDERGESYHIAGR